MGEYKYIDLFCGLGAFHTAFGRCSNGDASYSCVFACDIDADVRSVYYENYHIMPHGDINTIDPSTLPDFDILCAGFPCQPFSIAGKKEGFACKGKGNLFYSMLRIIDCKQPPVLLLENVKHLCTIHGGRTFSTMLCELKARGYHVEHKVIDSKHHNCPQSRQRIYIVCTKGSRYAFRHTQHPIVPVSAIIDRDAGAPIDYTEKYSLEACAPSKSMMKYKLVHKETKKGGRQGERVYGTDSYGPTVCASSGGPGGKTGLYDVNGAIRTLTISETLQMFTFDTTYKYSTLRSPKKMLFYLGNSIVVNVLVDIIQQLHTFVNKKTKSK